MDKSVLEEVTKEKLNVCEESGCWLWCGQTTGSGSYKYGLAFATSLFEPKLAHRLSWELYVGPIAAGAQIRHHCCNSHCVRPGHLFQLLTKTKRK